MNEFIFFGHQGAVNNPLAFFQKQNYVICRNALDKEPLKILMKHYNEKTLKSRKSYLRQSTHWEKHNLSDVGGLTNGLLNPHCYTRRNDKKLADYILKICSQRGIHSALTKISGQKSYLLFQTMLFDHSTTRPHQDWIYLDSRPNGHVIGAWIALEDIFDDGIRFFVYPDSHLFMPQVEYQKNPISYYDDFLLEIDQHLAKKSYQMYAPALQQGDIFFWSSKIIHGSIEGTSYVRRRRSLAVHFLPTSMKAGNLERDFDFLEFDKRYNLIHTSFPRRNFILERFPFLSNRLK